MKIKQHMNMIGHDNIAGYINVILMKMIEPFVNTVIGICYFKYLQPFIASEGYKIKAVLVLIMLKANRHELKILQLNPGVSARHKLGEKTPADVHLLKFGERGGGFKV